MEINQFLAGMSYGDAISNQAIDIRDGLRSWGFGSEIYSVSRHINPRSRKYCQDYRQHRSRQSRDNVAILHFSIASEINDYFATIPERKIMVYHNLTPPRYYQGINKRVAAELEVGRKKLAAFKDVPDLVLGVSQYNCAELKSMGYHNPQVLPLVLDRKKFAVRPNEELIRIHEDHCKRFLFVGRFVPNKKFDDCILAFHHYNKYINSDSKLFLVGSYAGSELYHDYLRSLILQLKLNCVHLVGHVTFQDLLAYYRLAHVFLCMSEHEGFCIPLLEAMCFDVPIIAYKAAAVPETLGGAGILTTEKDYAQIAEMAHLVFTDDCLRERIVATQRRRLEEFSLEKMLQRLKGYVDHLHQD